MAVLRILLLCIAASVLYGIVHDQITARICVEYFTIGHPPILGGTTDPTLLGLGWGVIATWWVGLGLGVPVACAARVGSGWPKYEPRRLVRPLGVLLLGIAVVAALAGLVGHALAARGHVWLTGDLAELVPPDRHVAFLTDLWTHLASYAAGFVGGLMLCGWVLYRRIRESGRRVRLSDEI